MTRDGSPKGSAAGRRTTPTPVAVRLTLLFGSILLAGCIDPTADEPPADVTPWVGPTPEAGAHQGVVVAPLLDARHAIVVAAPDHATLDLELTASQPTMGKAAVLVYVVATVRDPSGVERQIRAGPTTAVGGAEVVASLTWPAPPAGEWDVRVEVWPRGLPAEYRLAWCAGGPCGEHTSVDPASEGQVHRIADRGPPGASTGRLDGSAGRVVVAPAAVRDRGHRCEGKSEHDLLVDGHACA